MAKHSHVAIMTIAPSGTRAEIPRGAEFTPASPQEAIDLVQSGCAKAIAPEVTPKPRAPAPSDRAGE